MAARLAPTGTGLDTAVYCTLDTMDILLAAAEEKGISHKLTSEDSGETISAVYVKVRDGYDVGLVNNKLNGHVRKATAIRTKNMLTQVSDSLHGISHTVGILIGAVWVMAFLILLIVFAMMIRERRREFAVLRLLGMSRRKLCAMVLAETALSSLFGGIAGIGLASLAVFPFTTLIEQRLALPYLSLSPLANVCLAALSLALTVMAGMASSYFAAWALCRTDPGTTLREGA